MLPPTRRVILLGASNLTRSIATVVETARHIWMERLEIMAAMGHGRSFGQDSSICGKKISGIFSSPLWEELRRRPPLPTVALLTDIGNDLLYEVPVEQLQEWVEGCLNHLAEVNATTVITQLPLASLASLSELKYRFFRTLFFPKSTLPLSQVQARAEQMNAWLIGKGLETKTPVISASSEWYRFDPIHLARSSYRVAWPVILSSWDTSRAVPVLPRTQLLRWAYLRSLAPLERSVFGIPQHCQQPSGLLKDGTTISLF